MEEVPRTSVKAQTEKYSLDAKCHANRCKIIVVNTPTSHRLDGLPP